MNSSNLMNYSDLNAQARADRRRLEKSKRKTVIRLIGMEKIDKRTYKNLKTVFGFMGEHEEFTGPQIQKAKGLKGPALYSLLDVLERRGLIEEAGRIKSAGRGKTKVYCLTLEGKIVASYINDDADLLINTLRQVAEKTANPLKRFTIEAFIENFPSGLMREILELSMLEASVNRAKNVEKNFDVDDLLLNVLDAFASFPFLEKNEEVEQISKKIAESIEKSPYRDWIFLYFKMLIESSFLYRLEGEKLAKYAESLKRNPLLLNIPCYNPKCTNVIVVNNPHDMDIFQYCEECKKREPSKAY